MKNISEIMTKVGRHTLVLLDELGSGTEPNEGASLAIAITERSSQSALSGRVRFGQSVYRPPCAKTGKRPGTRIEKSAKSTG